MRFLTLSWQNNAAAILSLTLVRQWPLAYTESIFIQGETKNV